MEDNKLQQGEDDVVHLLSAFDSLDDIITIKWKVENLRTPTDQYNYYKATHLAIVASKCAEVKKWEIQIPASLQCPISGDSVGGDDGDWISISKYGLRESHVLGFAYIAANNRLIWVLPQAIASIDGETGVVKSITSMLDPSSPSQRDEIYWADSTTISGTITTPLSTIKFECSDWFKGGLFAFLLDVKKEGGGEKLLVAFNGAEGILLDTDTLGVLARVSYSEAKSTFRGKGATHKWMMQLRNVKIEAAGIIYLF